MSVLRIAMSVLRTAMSVLRTAMSVLRTAMSVLRTAMSVLRTTMSVLSSEMSVFIISVSFSVSEKHSLLGLWVSSTSSLSSSLSSSVFFHVIISLINSQSFLFVCRECFLNNSLNDNVSKRHRTLVQYFADSLLHTLNVIYFLPPKFCLPQLSHFLAELNSMIIFIAFWRQFLILFP